MKRTPDEIRAYITENVTGRSRQELADMVNAKFGTDYTAVRIASCLKNWGLRNGLTGRFQPGHVPPNKGKKGYCAPGSKKTQFKPGILPANSKPIGYERINRDGYTEVKVRMRKSRPNCNDNFVLKHRLIWEQTNGPIPDGYIVIFKDGDKSNFNLDNLMLITKAENAVLNQSHLRSSEPEFMETTILLADLKSAVSQCKKKF